jgi:hypothetical protein
VSESNVSRSYLSLLAAFALACASSPPRNAAQENPKCSVRLAPRAEPVGHGAVASPNRKAALSQLVVHVEAPLQPIAKELEQRVQKRLAEGRFGIGPGGTVSYTVDRGPLTLSTTASALVVEAPVQARAEACRGANCYASCEPQALVRVELPLLLRADYRFAPATVSVHFTRGCKVRALGFLTIDLTPTLEAELESKLGDAGRQIDRQLPDLKTDAERLWRQLLAPRELPLGACLVLQPSGLVEGPLTPSREQLRLRFAVLATPELRARCAEPTNTELLPALPPLRVDPALAEQGSVQLGMVTPLAALAPTGAASAEVTAWGSDVDVAVTLAGEVCGELAFSARPDFSGSGQVIALTAAQLTAGERERLLEHELHPAELLRKLTASARVTPLISVQGFREAAPGLASAQSQPNVEVSATVSATRAAGAAARGEELVAWLEARGSVTLRPRLAGLLSY